MTCGRCEKPGATVPTQLGLAHGKGWHPECLETVLDNLRAYDPKGTS